MLVGALYIGLTVADLDEFTVGEILDFITIYNNMTDCDDEENDDDIHYEILKETLPSVLQRYEKGEITEREYNEFMDALGEFER